MTTYVLGVSSLPLLGRRDREPAAGTAPAEGGRGAPRGASTSTSSLAAPERESDGDGLTDLDEEALATDPLDPDTDHDGVKDGFDMLPRVAPRSGRKAPRARLAAMFAAMESRDRSGGYPDPRRAPTQFWVADRQLFTALHPRRRLAVLTPGELDLAEQKLGSIFARTIESSSTTPGPRAS